MKLEDICFSVNDYDWEGDVTKEGIFLHLGETRIFIAEDLDGFRNFIKHLDNMYKKLRENGFW